MPAEFTQPLRHRSGYLQCLHTFKSRPYSSRRRGNHNIFEGISARNLWHVSLHAMTPFKGRNSRMCSMHSSGKSNSSIALDSKISHNFRIDIFLGCMHPPRLRGSPVRKRGNALAIAQHKAFRKIFHSESELCRNIHQQRSLKLLNRTNLEIFRNLASSSTRLSASCCQIYGVIFVRYVLTPPMNNRMAVADSIKDMGYISTRSVRDMGDTGRSGTCRKCSSRDSTMYLSDH